jgi:hypothetical protein
MNTMTTSPPKAAADDPAGGLGEPVVNRPQRGFTLDILEKSTSGGRTSLRLAVNASVNWDPTADLRWGWATCPDLWVLAGDGTGEVGRVHTSGIPATGCTDEVKMLLDEGARIDEITFFVYSGAASLEEVRGRLGKYLAKSETLDLSPATSELRERGVASDPQEAAPWDLADAGSGLLQLTQNLSTLALVGAAGAGLYLAWPVVGELRDAAARATDESNDKQQA